MAVQGVPAHAASPIVLTLVDGALFFRGWDALSVTVVMPMAPAPDRALSIACAVVIAIACVPAVWSISLIDIALWHQWLFIIWFLRIITFGLWVAWLDIDVLHVPVHARDTVAFRELHLDKAVSAPPTAP